MTEQLIKCGFCHGMWTTQEDFDSHNPCPAALAAREVSVDLVETAKKLGKDEKAWKRWLSENKDFVATVGLGVIALILKLISFPAPTVDRLLREAEHGNS